MSVNPCCVQVTSFDLSKAITFNRLFSKVKLSPTARLVIKCLADFYNYKKGGLMFPGQNVIADCTGASEKSITNAINELRTAGLILTVKKGARLNYYFSTKFFDLLEITDYKSKNFVSTSEKITVTCKEQIKENKVFKKDKFKNLSNLKNPNENLASQTKILLKNIEEDRKKSCTPLDFTYEQAKNYLDNLIPELRNSFFARELRKKWNIQQD